MQGSGRAVEDGLLLLGDRVDVDVSRLPYELLLGDIVDVDVSRLPDDEGVAKAVVVVGVLIVSGALVEVENVTTAELEADAVVDVAGVELGVLTFVDVLVMLLVSVSIVPTVPVSQVDVEFARGKRGVDEAGGDVVVIDPGVLVAALPSMLKPGPGSGVMRSCPYDTSVPGSGNTTSCCSMVWHPLPTLQTNIFGRFCKGSDCRFPRRINL